MKLFCADLRSNDFVEIMRKLSGLNVSSEDIDNMSYFEK